MERYSVKLKTQEGIPLVDIMAEFARKHEIQLELLVGADGDSYLVTKTEHELADGLPTIGKVRNYLEARHRDKVVPYLVWLTRDGRTFIDLRNV